METLNNPLGYFTAHVIAYAIAFALTLLIVTLAAAGLVELIVLAS